MYQPTPDTVLVKVNSHRARDKAKRWLLPQAWYSWRRDGEWFEVPQEHAETVLAIKGIKRARWKDDLRPCISFR